VTHTNHRRGSKQSLEGDFVLLSMVDRNNEAQCNYNGSYNDRAQRLLSICTSHNPVGLTARLPGTRLRYMKYWDSAIDSGIHKLTPREQIQRSENIDYICHAVFTNRDNVEAALLDLKEADLGISIVISGIFEIVAEICRDVGLEPHTVNMSLGTWGKTELLPKSSELELCTMCGHAMISPILVEKMIDQVRKGVETPEAAAVELGKQCTCNIFNTVRAAEIIRSYIAEDM